MQRAATLRGKAKLVASIAPLLAVTVAVIIALMMLASTAKLASARSKSEIGERYLSPLEILLSPDGRQLYVVCQASDELRVVDLESGKVVTVVPLGRAPRGITLSPDGTHIYVTNSTDDTVSVVDAATLKVTRTLPTGFEPAGIVINRTGDTLYVANRLSSDISVIDVKTGQETKRLLAGRGASYLALSPDGKFIYGTHIYPNPGAFRNPPNSEITVIDTERQTVVERKPMHNAEGVTVIDVARLLHFVRSRSEPFVNDLSASANYVIARIPVGHNPRGVLLSKDGKRLYVANRLDDNIAVIDTAANRVVSTIDLGGPKTINALRRGERVFFTADYAFQGQFGCSNCHLDSTIDGRQWDLEPDGFGKDIVDNRSLEDLSGTEPFKWNGGNPDMPTECGPRTEKFFFRSQSFTDHELTDLVTFVYSLPYRPNRYRLANGELTAAQERGKAIFERTTYKNGKPIPQANQCTYCHSGPKFTNQKQLDVGTGKSTDRSHVLDVPHLRNVAYSAPYLHDGSARSLEEIWTVFNPKDTHGVTNDLAKDELNDLIEYLKTL